MKKSTKITGNLLTQGGGFESSEEKTLEEAKYQDGKLTKQIIDLGDFFTSGWVSKHWLQAKFNIYEKQQELLNQAKDLAEYSGFQINKVESNFILPWLQEAGISDSDKDIEKMWVNLLASQACFSKEVSKRKFIEIAKQLEPIEVKILNKRFMEMWTRVGEKDRSWYFLTVLNYFGYDRYMNEFELTNGQIDNIIANLTRLGLLMQSGGVAIKGSDGISNTDKNVVVETLDNREYFVRSNYKWATFTKLGWEFMKYVNFVKETNEEYYN
jgi:hypothetical protein